MKGPGLQCAARSVWPWGVGLAVTLTLATPAHALEDSTADWDALKACEKRICTMILNKEPTGGDLSCALAKAWPKETLDGGESSLVKWGFGDARCTVDLGLERKAILAALTESKYSLEVPEHHVKCQVESSGEMKDVKVRLAPRIDFKNGKADKIWVNLKEVDGPGSIETTVWAAANLADGVGLFHKSMVKSVNKFVHKQCAKRYGPGAETAEDTSESKESTKTTATAPAKDKDASEQTDKSAVETAKADLEAGASARAKDVAKPEPATAAPAEARPSPGALAEKSPAPSEKTEADPATASLGATPEKILNPAASEVKPSEHPKEARAGTVQASAETKPSRPAARGSPAKPRTAQRAKPLEQTAAEEPIDDDIDQNPWSVAPAKSPSP